MRLADHNPLLMTEDLEYCDAIYRRFVERRAHSLVLTLRDWDQILTWRERDIPLGLVLRVIDRHVERSAGEGRPLRLTELGPLVRGAWMELRRAGVGRPEETVEAPEPTFSMSFVLDRVAEPAAEKLRLEVPPGPAGEAALTALGHALGRLRRRAIAGVTAEQLLTWETRVNRKMLEAAEAAATPELIGEARKMADEAAATASSRSAELVRTKLYHLALRRLLGVPRLRLFEPS
jgi:hypothetical protein